MSLLRVENLHVEVDGKAILAGVDLRVEAGEVHAVMGPNGSGKSTLANVLAGRDGYDVRRGALTIDGRVFAALPPEERSLCGLFLALQYPIEIPGVSNMEFLKAAVDAHAVSRGEAPPSAVDFVKRAREAAARLDLNPDFLKRGVNDGFSGGEKKRNEILQLLVLQPRLAVLDETDSGLDIDALQVVADGINAYRGDGNAVVLVTHYQRLLNYVVPDHVHVLANGRIVHSGDRTLALELEERGYGWLGD